MSSFPSITCPSCGHVLANHERGIGDAEITAVLNERDRLRAALVDAKACIGIINRAGGLGYSVHDRLTALEAVIDAALGRTP